MAKIINDTPGGDTSKLLLDIPNTVDPKILRVNSKGDQYIAQARECYKQLEKSYASIANCCKKILNGNAVYTKSITNILTEAKKKANNQSYNVKNKRNQLNESLELTKNIMAAVGSKVIK